MTQDQYTYFGPIKVISPLGTEEVETLSQAKEVLAYKKSEFAESTNYAFSVNGCNVDSAGNKNVFPCNLSTGEYTTTDFFEAFNFQTGVYVKFDSFQVAKDYVQALQTQYLADVNNSFMLQQQAIVDSEPTWLTLSVEQ